MSKVGGRAGGKGGGSKSKAKGAKDAAALSRVKKMASSESEYLVTLRAALRDEAGADKNVLADLVPAFHRFERNGLAVGLNFATRLTRHELRTCMDLCRGHMEALYDASGYGWDEGLKHEELTDKAARFLLLRDTDDNLVGFVNFRFTLQAELEGRMEGKPCLFVYDLHFNASAQRKGLGKHVMQVLELIARKQNMSFMMLPVVVGNAAITNLLQTKLRGFSVDADYTIESSYSMWAKCIDASLMPPKSAPALASASADAPPASAPELITPIKAAAESPTLAASKPCDKLNSPNCVMNFPSPGASSVCESDAVMPASPEPATASPASAALPSPSLNGWNTQSKEEDADEPEEEGAEASAANTLEHRFGSLDLDPSIAQGEREAAADDSEEEADDIMDQLVEMFMQQNGREPTEAEMAQWMQTLKEAAADGGLQLDID